MEQYRRVALEIIHEYYYALPNNGSLNHGLMSCDRRYKEAIQCALIGVKRLILTLEFISTESNDPRIMSRINIYDKVQDELYKMQADNSKVTLDELPEVFNSNEQHQAREINSPIIKQLIDETTPEELAKIDTEMTNNKQQTAVDAAELAFKLYPFSNLERNAFITGYNKAKEMECVLLCAKEQKSIELPSDEEIEKESFDLYANHNTYSLNVRQYKAFKRGATWMRNKIQGGNK